MENINQPFDLLSQLLKNDRSVRRFDHSKKVSNKTLRELVSLTRYCASGRNLQPLKYYLVSSDQECEAVFPTLLWAGYYKDWDGPAPEERPTGFIVQCLDTELTKTLLCDDGLQLQAISLGATAMGLGRCIIKAFDAPALAKILSLPDHLKPRYVYAVGVPAEEVRLTELTSDGDIKYFRDECDRQCVPKRSLDDILIN